MLHRDPTSHEIDLAHVENWVFDLDNTLYPADCHLFNQIDARMTAFVAEKLSLNPVDARRLQKDYYVRFGTTMSGLMREHGVAPGDFLEFVHDIDLSPVDENIELANHIRALPGRKFIFTNGSVRHAENVTEKLGLAGLFNDIYDIEAADYTPKPHQASYEKFLGRCAIDPKGAAMFEDLAHNLEAAHSLGMTTILVYSAAQWLEDEPPEKRPAVAGDDHDHVHHMTDDITGFLGAAAARHAAA